MVFSYYRRLSASQKKIYRRSDDIAAVALPRGTQLHALTAPIHQALSEADKRRLWDACQALCTHITTALKIPPVTIVVLDRRPADDYEELHGFYKPREEREQAMITVWMRTARREQVVAFRTFLRTLLHELCHHLDYEYFKLPESFHTEGFYKRESSLFHQLVPQGEPA
jgi:hypothetical protein